MIEMNQLKLTHKKCSCCKLWKFISDFGKDSKRSDGLNLYCNSCCRDKTKAHDDAMKLNPDRYLRKLNRNRNYMAARRADPDFAEFNDPEYRKTFAKKNPDKRRAYAKLAYHIKKGNIQPKPCCVCGDLNAEAHHEDYSKALDVVWYCRKHHRNEHRIIPT